MHSLYSRIGVNFVVCFYMIVVVSQLNLFLLLFYQRSFAFLTHSFTKSVFPPASKCTTACVDSVTVFSSIHSRLISDNRDEISNSTILSGPKWWQLEQSALYFSTVNNLYSFNSNYKQLLFRGWWCSSKSNFDRPYYSVTSRNMSSTDNKVNLLDLAAVCVSCTATASSVIVQIAGVDVESRQQQSDTKNTRLKSDGTCVTDADYAAQTIIVNAIHDMIHQDIRILGEEEIPDYSAAAETTTTNATLNRDIHERALQEIQLRYTQRNSQQQQQCDSNSTSYSHLPLSPENADCSTPTTAENDDTILVDVSRVRIVIDPLDGTKSYTDGEYDVVSILICILLDDTPHFGVIAKPFGYSSMVPSTSSETSETTTVKELPSMFGTQCATIYGGPLLNAAYIAGNKQLLSKSSSNTTALPRAVISTSRSKGVVYDFCKHLSDPHGLLDVEPVYVSGAGEKSVRLLLQYHGETLWFFPKPGTCLWDVAAPDAILRALHGKLTDKHGRALDYTGASENVHGIVACMDLPLHTKCIALFQQDDWLTRE